MYTVDINVTGGGNKYMKKQKTEVHEMEQNVKRME